MPPIAGIISLGPHACNLNWARQIASAATYLKPRRMFESASDRFWMASFLVLNSSTPDSEVFWHHDKTYLLADATLYGELEEEGVWQPEPRGSAPRLSRLISRLGVGQLSRLRGDFAFVQYNIQTGDILCCRDHLGVRPFFYSVYKGHFIFASELRLVISCMDPPPELNTEYLLDTLVTKKASKQTSPYREIYRLPPGHVLRVIDGSATTEAYWKPNADKKIMLEKVADYSGMLREKLLTAVQSRLQDVDYAGAELSGGLDSSAVTGIAVNHLRGKEKELRVFSNVCPENPPCNCADERRQIACMAEYARLNLTHVDNLGGTPAGLLKTAVDIQACFLQQNFSIFNGGLYQAASQQGVQVLLSGFGGDEMVSARTGVAWDELIRERQWRIFMMEWFKQGISVRNLLLPIRILTRMALRGGIRTVRNDGVFAPALLDERFRNLPLQPGYATKYKLRKRMEDKNRKPDVSTLAQRQLFRLLMDHLPQRMEYCYAAAAQYGIEYRYPLLDKELVETFLAFPPWVKQNRRVNRFLFREAIQGIVPEEIRLRNDKSVSTIPQMLHGLVTDRDALMQIVADASGHPVLNQLFDLSRFSDWYDRLVKRDAKEMNYLMPGAFWGYLMILLYFEKSPLKNEATTSLKEGHPEAGLNNKSGIKS